MVLQLSDIHPVSPVANPLVTTHSCRCEVGALLYPPFGSPSKCACVSIDFVFGRGRNMKHHLPLLVSISKRWNEQWINWKERVKNVCWELWKIRFDWKAIALHHLVQPFKEAKKDRFNEVTTLQKSPVAPGCAPAESPAPQSGNSKPDSSGIWFCFGGRRILKDLWTANPSHIETSLKHSRTCMNQRLSWIHLENLPHLSAVADIVGRSFNPWGGRQKKPTCRALLHRLEKCRVNLPFLGSTSFNTLSPSPQCWSACSTSLKY